ncbi:response regulator [Geminicoccus roseus]|uniref:response regulator n=1 Tax=Geminicoccus roseus TaxID=404900 RepID=UPI00146FBE5B|nr:response regulator [Geminicoccus roseus]
MTVAAVSHELREPMNGVLGMARLLGETQLSDEQRGLVAAITDSAEALLTVINDMLDLSRAEAGRLELLDTVFDPRLLLERIVAPFQVKARAKHLRFETMVAQDVPARLRGDPGRLRQILGNVIGNAVKFTDAGGVTIRMRVHPARPNGFVLFEIADTGPGFDASSMAKLFSGYNQIGGTTARAFGGSGLGLMVSMRLIRAMGGKVAVDARPGRGARFVIDLPLAAAGAAPHEGAPEPVSLAGLELLVVEPRPELRERLRAAGLAWGMGVRGAAGTQDALREIQEAGTRGVRFDLLIASAAITDDDTVRLLQVMRDRPGAGFRAVCLAGSGLRGDAVRARALGYDAYLAAPFHNDDLMQILMGIVQASENTQLLTRHHVDEQGGRALRILVADDNPVNAKLATLLLGKAGHDVTAVPDGAAAVAMVGEGQFDLVLMDVQMPGTDGLAATRTIRRLADPDRQKIPIVALTADAMPGDEAAVRAAGMDAYLTKPIDRPKLLSTVRYWGERSLRRRQDITSTIT